MKSNLLQKGLAGLLTTAMVIGMLPTGDLSVTVHAADTASWEAPVAPQIGFGTKGIIDPAEATDTTVDWTGCYVYYGTYDVDNDDVKEPTKYRVLDVDSTDFGGNTILLHSNDVLLYSKFIDGTDNNAYLWKESRIKSILNDTFLYKGFSTMEQNGIAESYKAEDSATDNRAHESFSRTVFSPLTGEKLFILGMGEVKNTTYGFTNTIDESASRKKNGDWWMRTYSSSGASNEYYVDKNGELNSLFIQNACGICPTFNIEHSSIFLNAVSGMDKSQEIKKDSAMIQDVSSVERTLTLYDSRKQVELTADGSSAYIDENADIWVPYSYTDTAETDEKVNQISVMITDKVYTDEDAKILYYGALQGIADIEQTTGMGRFVFPDGIDLTNSHVYLIAEHVSGENQTDYASQPAELLTIKKGIEDVAIDLSIPTAEQRTFSSTAVAVINGQSDFSQIPAVTWKQGNEIVSGTAAYDTAYTASVTLDAVTGYGYRPDVKISINGKTMDQSHIQFGTDGTVTVSDDFILESAKLKGVIQPQAITGIANGSSLEQIKQQFPSVITIETEDDLEKEAAINWDFDSFAEGSYDPQVKTEQTFKVKGIATLPEDVSNPNHISLEVIVPVTVSAGEQVIPEPITPEPITPAPVTPEPVIPTPVAPVPEPADPAPVAPEQPETVSPQVYKANSIKMDQSTSLNWAKGKLTVTWNTLQKADGYDIFAEPCGTKITESSLITTVTGKKTSVSLVKIAGKKLSGNKTYKVRIKAYTLSNGNKVYIGGSQDYHIAGKNSTRYTNVKKISVSRRTVFLKKGRSTKIKAVIKKQSSKKKLLPESHGKSLRYYTTDETIATVTPQGMIKAKKKGTCYVYVTALNGIKTKVKVTVK